ncbi:light-regulated signal transduction histidine kinase (bacteriophytochrome) [Skermanella aerolata]|uniref:histidine kinase dimerization/phosphoacceptor domain -containing protein n=1 Tax=Skermanella aerolata TaxID=393310 RepID=UPI003D1F1C29
MERLAASQGVDLTPCEREPIHIPGAIQPHGALLALHPTDWALMAYSANASTTFGIELGDLGQRPLDTLIGDTLAAEIREAFAKGELDGANPFRTTACLPGNGVLMDFAVHSHNGIIIVETEQTTPGDLPAALPRTMVRLRDASSLAELGRLTVQSIRALSGFERVLIYRFDAEWNGEAIAEDKAPDLEPSLLGLHFPESDIPRQARELYARNHSRFVPDRDAAPVSLLSISADGGAQPLDLSFARLRALSPVHLEYHRNLNVNGSMSVSVMKHGRLWGLVIGHHRQPLLVPPALRTAVTLLVDAFAMRLTEVETAADWDERRDHVATHARLLEQMAGADDFVPALTSGPVTMARLFNAGGAAVIRDGEVRLDGGAPPAEVVLDIMETLRARSKEGEPVTTEHLAGISSRFVQHSGTASGVMAVYFGPDHRDALMWFRPEVTRTITWGGDPSKPVSFEAGQMRILPRRSFERWTERMRCYSQPWSPWTLEIAQSLAQTIDEVIVRHQRKLGELSGKLREIEALATEKDGLLVQKDMLMREVNHRVKNSLHMIASLLSLQGDGIEDPDTRRQFADAHNRVSTVAQLHQRLYQTDKLQSVEFDQYLHGLCNDLSNFMLSEGEDYILEVEADPAEFSTDRAIPLALIVNELVTNAFKYAYPPGSEGTIRVSFTSRTDGGYLLVVSDQGTGLKPDFQPSRGGLGMTIVTSLCLQLGASLSFGSTTDVGGARFAVSLPPV